MCATPKMPQDLAELNKEWENSSTNQNEKQGLIPCSVVDEPIKNTQLGIDGNFRKDIPILTKWIDKYVPFVKTKEKSTITGAIEAAICYMLLSHYRDHDSPTIPAMLWDGERDPELAVLNFASEASSAPKLRYCMSNSFAFGGSNVTLILGIDSE